MTSDLPKAPITASRPNADHQGTSDVIVRCPFCVQTHRHGVAGGSEEDVRAAGCNGYLYVVMATDPETHEPPPDGWDPDDRHV